jgi:predicted nucleic acid-binding protein
VKHIADTGLLLGALARNDPYHKHAAEAFKLHAPWLTCEAVLVELSYHLDDPLPGLLLVQRGDVILDFSIEEQSDRILELLTKYKDCPMSLADACLVRMTELHRLSKVWTVDPRDFHVYRRNGRESVPFVALKPN